MDSGYLVVGNLDYCFVGLKAVSFGKDTKGNRIAILVMDFSHTSDKAESFLFTINPKIFQDGIECEQSFYYSGENLMTEIKKGATIEVTQAYIITNGSSLEIEIEPMFNFNDEKLESTFVVP